MRLKSSVCEPRYYDSMVAKVLAEGKGVIVRWGLKEAGVQSYEPTCLRADAQAGGQKRHIRPSLWVRQHNMSKPRVQEIR
ncbi:MAG: hypothetical protein LWW99_12135 [Deltaproteobacteria bacterium]|nr:hypothetical protein [Deltaproteobacteria bacterium]